MDLVIFLKVKEQIWNKVERVLIIVDGGGWVQGCHSLHVVIFQFSMCLKFSHSEILRKCKMHVLFHLAIVLQGVYPRDVFAFVPNNMYL